jgi:hypothetical protein
VGIEPEPQEFAADVQRLVRVEPELASALVVVDQKVQRKLHDAKMPVGQQRDHSRMNHAVGSKTLPPWNPWERVHVIFPARKEVSLQRVIAHSMSSEK